MPVKRKSQAILFDGPDKPGETVNVPHVPKTPVYLYANIGNHIIVELTKFGQLMLARCEDDSMYFMQNDGRWAEFIFEVITK